VVDGRDRLHDMAEPPLRPADERASRRIHDELAQMDFVLPGSVVERRMRCGKANCRCRADPPELHGPYLQWTRRGSDGTTVTRYLSPEQLERYQRWFDNARRLRALVSTLEDLSLRVVERAEGWEPAP
jgi:hypothetical protein